MYILIILIGIALMILRAVLTRNMVKQSEEEARRIMRKEDKDD